MDQHIYVLKEDVEGRSWNGHGADPEFTPLPMLKGSKVKVVMTSRFGDVGITPDLTVQRGYQARVCPQLLTPARPHVPIPHPDDHTLKNHRHACPECFHELELS